MKNLRGKFERFCYRNQNKGVPNLMFWIVAINVVTYVFAIIDPSNLLYRLLCFDRSAVLRGQVWRLFTFVALDLQSSAGILWAIVAAIFLHAAGQSFGKYLGQVFALICII